MVRPWSPVAETVEHGTWLARKACTCCSTFCTPSAMVKLVLISTTPSCSPSASPVMAISSAASRNSVLDIRSCGRQPADTATAEATGRVKRRRSIQRLMPAHWSTSRANRREARIQPRSAGSGRAAAPRRGTRPRPLTRVHGPSARAFADSRCAAHVTPTRRRCDIGGHAHEPGDPQPGPGRLPAHPPSCASFSRPTSPPGPPTAVADSSRPTTWAPRSPSSGTRSRSSTRARRGSGSRSRAIFPMRSAGRRCPAAAAGSTRLCDP